MLHNLLLSDLHSGLHDLFEERVDALRETGTGRDYETLLRSLMREIEELPPALVGTPLADRLAEVDRRHDGYGAAIYHLTEAYLRVPSDDRSLAAAHAPRPRCATPATWTGSRWRRRAPTWATGPSASTRRASGWAS